MRTWYQIGCGLLAAVLLLGTVPQFSAAAAELETSAAAAEDSGISVDTSQDAKYDVFTYRENTDGGITITSCDTAATSAEIPAEIDGAPVTQIGDAAFMNCSFVSTVTIPEHVTAIGESAFSSCPMLCEVVLPEGLTSIGKGAFESCSMLNIINLPKTLTALPDALFYKCTFLSILELPDTLQSIGNETFYSCTALASLELPDGLTSIGKYAFQNCQKLTDITLPASCTSIGDYAFDGCQALTAFSVAEGNSAYCAEDGVLFSADQSTLIRYPQAREETGYAVPDACRTLGDWSFIGASTLEQIDLNQVTAIGEDCFYYCTALKNIAVPDGVTQLNGRCSPTARLWSR